MQEVSAAYKAMYGNSLKLHGYKLRQSLENGRLQGIRYDASNLALTLDKATATRKASAPGAGKSARSPDWAQLSKALRSIIANKGPLLLGSVSLDSHLRGHDLKISLTSGKLQGIRYNSSNGKVEMAETPVVLSKGAGPLAASAPAKQRNRTSVAAVNHSGAEELLGTKASARDGGKHRSPASKDGSTSIRPPNCDQVVPSLSMRGLRPSYVLIDSPNSWRKSSDSLFSGGALGSTLQQICSQGMVVMQLNGHQLGSEAGGISLIKVWRHYFLCAGRLVAVACRKKLFPASFPSLTDGVNADLS